MSERLRATTSRRSNVFAVLISLLVIVFTGTGMVRAAIDDQAGRLSDSSQGPIVFPKIDRQPKPADLKRGLLQSLPKRRPGGTNLFEVDLRGYDLSKLDIVSVADDLVYALAVQVEPDVTPQRFWALATKTGRVVERQDVSLGPILDPVRLIAALKAGELADPEAAEAELKRYSADPMQ